MLNKKFLFGVILTGLMCMTACSKGGNEVTEIILTTASESISSAKQLTVTETEMQETEEVTETTVESTEIPKYKYKDMLEKYISYMKKDHSELFKNGSECRICLQDIYGDDTPEMSIIISYQKGYSNEYFFAMGKNDDIHYIGRTLGLDDYKFYSDGEENYIISKHFYENKIPALIISRFGNVQPKIFCDSYEYSNSSADEFIQNTQLTFCRFDEYFDADNEIPAEVIAKDFYYEDTGTYEAYLLSPEILELTGIELSEYRIPYNVGIQCYVAKRDEYSAVMDKLDDMMTELNIIPEFDSGRLEIKDLIPWLKNLQE